MEVSGQRPEKSFQGTVGKSSGEDGKVYCQPCISDGDWVVAVGYCQNCHEYFCAACLRLHRKQAISRKHIILEGENMPKAHMSALTLTACSELCPKHTNEIVKFYCSAHDVAGCGDCMVLYHKACKVDRIQDISRSYFNGAEHQDLLQKIDHFLQHIEQVNKAVTSNEKNMQQTYSKAENNIKAFKKQIIDYLDKAEADMLAELNKKIQSDEKLISSLKENGISMRAKIQELHEKLQLQLNQANELFVAAKEVKANISLVGDNIKQLQQDCRFRQYEFVCSKHVSKMLASQHKFGELLVGEKIAEKMTRDVATVEKKTFAEMKSQFDCEIRIKAKNDSKDCEIYSCALVSSSLIALADVGNKCVKMVDIKNKNLSAKYQLKSFPNGVAVVTPSCIAVTLPAEQKILFLAISQNGNLSKSHDIVVNGDCRNIDCKDDKLIVLYCDHVEILNINGKMIKCISLPSLKLPIDIAFAHNSQTFYISNNSAIAAGSVLKYDFEGNLITGCQYVNFIFASGSGITKDDIVLMCEWERNGSIHIISPEGKEIGIIMDSKHVRYPWCVSFCDTTNKLFLCNNEARLDSKLKNVLKVFQLK